MITVRELINKLNEVENKDLPVHVWLNDILDATDYNAADRLDIVYVDDLVEGKIDICVEPPFWNRVENDFEFHNYKVIIFEGKDYGRYKGFYFYVYEKNARIDEPIYQSIDDPNRADEGWFADYNSAEFEAKLYINNVVETQNKTK